MIHSLKPDPVTFRQEPNRIFDFMSQTPESMHMLMNLFSPRGIPADYRHVQGFGVNTYKWVNGDGDTVLVKYHWMPKQGVSSMTEEDAANQQAVDVGHATRDLYDAIERGDHPEWELLVQMMSDDEHPELDFDPLDDTKVWPENEFPDTQRYRVGPNYLQLPVNQPKNAVVSTNQRDGLMTYLVDGAGENPHVNYGPSSTGGLREAD